MGSHVAGDRVSEVFVDRVASSDQNDQIIVKVNITIPHLSCECKQCYGYLCVHVAHSKVLEFIKFGNYKLCNNNIIGYGLCRVTGVILSVTQ